MSKNLKNNVRFSKAIFRNSLMNIAPGTIVAAFLTVALAGGAAAIAVDVQQTMRQRSEDLSRAGQNAIKARHALLKDAQFEGTPVCFKADGKETTDQNACDLMVWHGVKNELSVMPLVGPFAGIGVIFQPAANGGTLRIRHLAQEQKINVAGEIFSTPVLNDDPVEYVYNLRDFGSTPSASAWPNTDFTYTATANKRRVFKVSGAIVKGRAFEIAFGRQHKLSMNMTTGNFVFNTYGENTFYGQYKVMPPKPVLQVNAGPAF